jgi:hypothetical protein
MKNLNVVPTPSHKFTWSRFGGYECSSKGDIRFSAMYASLPDGRTIEMHYQLDHGGKGFQPGGTDWRIGKGKLAINGNTREQLWCFYKGLWQTWASNNMHLMRQLFRHARINGNTLSDRFATTEINQARALAEILTELSQRGKQ